MVIYEFGYLFPHTLDIIVGRPAWSPYILYSLSVYDTRKLFYLGTVLRFR
jgi:hypothetical protein